MSVKPMSLGINKKIATNFVCLGPPLSATANTLFYYFYIHRQQSSSQCLPSRTTTPTLSSNLIRLGSLEGLPWPANSAEDANSNVMVAARLVRTATVAVIPASTRLWSSFVLSTLQLGRAEVKRPSTPLSRLGCSFSEFSYQQYG
ncbi:hypothetical protein PM082_019920 [Marasmius tenuissimus]|nr:hypothetical protein PM082_019920 [Marasmius tenuissimus]